MDALPDATRGAATEALSEVLSFRLGEEEYAIDILAVREIRAWEKPTRIANAPEFIRGVINLRGIIVPIIDLRVRFGQAAPRYDALTVVIIVKVAGRVMGIVVDGVSDVVGLSAADIRPAPEFHAAMGRAYIRGLATLDGRMLILLDIEGLLTSEDMGLIERTALAA